MSDLPILSRDQLLEAKDDPFAETRTVPVPEWGGAVVVRQLSKGEVRKIRTRAYDKKSGTFDPNVFEGEVFVAGLTDPKLTLPDLEVLFDKSMAPFDRVLQAILDLSSIDLSAEAMEDAERSFPD